MCLKTDKLYISSAERISCEVKLKVTDSLLNDYISPFLEVFNCLNNCKFYFIKILHFILFPGFILQFISQSLFIFCFTELRKATLPVFYDMVECELRTKGVATMV